MRRFFTRVTPFLLFISFISCNHDKLYQEKCEEYEMAGEDESDEQDGIREAQEMEFELTKDMKLGYIPKYRLVQAVEDEMIKSRSGIANKITALTWSERGPNSDILGPGNGNPRGPLGTSTNASNVVTSGRVRAILFDLADPAHKMVWIGSVSGGLWETNDIASTAASAWSVVNDYFGNLAIAAICQDPTNTDILYFGTGEKTFNAGQVRGGGVWKSVDHGVTWNLLANTVNFINVSQMACDATGNLYVATIGSNGIQRSIDGGNNWTNITPTGLTTNVTEMKLSNTGRLHISCGYYNTGTSGYRFTDVPATVTSASWTAPATTFPTAYNVELTVTGDILYALPSNSAYTTPQIYKSVDGGLNWTATPTSPNAGTNNSIAINISQAWLDLAIGVDPANPNIVIAGGLNFYKSTDGGATWTQLTQWVGSSMMYVHADHHNVTWNNGQVLLGTDGGVFYSSDNGVLFTDRNDGLGLKQFYSCAIHPTTTNYFLAGAQDNGTHQLTSAGLAGSVEVVGGDGGYVHIDQNEPQYQFSSTTYGNYRRSTNGGANWVSVSYAGTVDQFINPTDYDDIQNKMYTGGTTGQYVRWDNPQVGNSFTAVPVTAFGTGLARSITVSPNTLNRVFFGTSGGRIVRVDNAQKNAPTGTNITGSGMTANNVSCVAIGTTDNNLLSTFSNYGAVHVWVTTTGGGTSGWTNITGTGLPDIPVRWAMFYPEDNTKAMLATEMGIYETDLINGASTVWVKNNSFPYVKTSMLQYRKSDGTLLAATYGRGLWTASIPFTAPYVRFTSNYEAKTEGTAATIATCRNYTDYTVNMTIDQAATGDANITLNLAGGGTAIQGVDFDFTTNGSFTPTSNILSFTSGSVAPALITIRVYNDAEVESDEDFTLTYTIGGGTNAQAAPGSQSYKFTILDNEALIPAGGTATIGSGNFGSYTQPFRSTFNNARSQYIYLASELNNMGLRAGDITAIGFNVTSKTSTQPYTGLTISLKNTGSNNFPGATFETGTTPVYSQSYSTTTGINTLTFSTPFTWDGTSNMLVEICYANTSATGSGDNISSSTTADLKGIWNRDNATSGCSLTAVYAGVGSDNVRADIILNGYRPGTIIETVLNSTITEYVATNGKFNFFNGANIINELSNVSADLGCVTSSIFEAGNTWQVLEAGERSQKVFDINPTTNPGASYTVGLYYTLTELAGKNPATIRIAKTTAPNMAAVNISNTVIVTTTVTPYGSNYLFSADFTGFSKFFLVDNLVALPVDLLSFSGYLNANGFSDLIWKTTNQINLKNFEVQRSYNGREFTTIGSVQAIKNPATIQDYIYTDQLKAKAINFYRLKMGDTDGRFKYSGIIRINNNKPDKFVELLQNPVRNGISFIIDNALKQDVSVTLFNSGGQQIRTWNLGKQQGTVLLPVDNKGMAAGVYTMRVRAGSRVESYRIVKQ